MAGDHLGFWEPPDPLPPTTRRSAELPGWSVDLPPIKSPNAPTLSILLVSWIEPDPVAGFGRKGGSVVAEMVGGTDIEGGIKKPA